ncbi:TRAP transporter small permease [Alteribacillus sp. YIM 98480]|uniref:TRAP transporter small permease n=1 Tax=Alteribacillus sp. YIM 98480 TaxID=2606599 RepID=UPI00131D9366|nr:TRAP transporter small permease [Alteribacillus sp. YIM 98480]
MRKINVFLFSFIKMLYGLIGLLMLLSLFLLFLNVILREMVNFSFVGIENISIFLIMWIVFIGSGLVFWNDEHISMDFLYDILPLPLRPIIKIIIDILVIITSLLLLYYGSLITNQLYQLNQMSSDGLVPLYMVMMSIPLGAFITLLFFGYKFVKRK